MFVVCTITRSVQKKNKKNKTKIQQQVFVNTDFLSRNSFEKRMSQKSRHKTRSSFSKIFWMRVLVAGSYLQFCAQYVWTLLLASPQNLFKMYFRYPFVTPGKLLKYIMHPKMNSLDFLRHKFVCFQNIRI